LPVVFVHVKFLTLREVMCVGKKGFEEDILVQEGERNRRLKKTA
jgi:hypothetical protein